jgi:hypothetical protein
MYEVIIGNKAADHLSIKGMSAAGANSSDYWGGNWVTCEVSIVAGGFRGKTQASLRREEFSRLLKQLEPIYTNLEGTPRYRSMEEWLDFEIKGDGRGHLTAKGYF